MSGFGESRGSNTTNTGAANAAIGVAIVDAKGDLIAATGPDVVARVAVGTDKQRLVADSTQTAGVRWASDTENSVASAKGDLIVATGPNAVAKQTVGADGQRLVADSTQTTGVKYVPDTTDYAVSAKGDLKAGTANQAVARVAVGSDDQALLADSAQAAGIRWGQVPSATVRQTQLSGPLDSNGYNATLSAGAGLNFNVHASPTPAVFTFANGFGSGGSVDTYTQLTADAANQGTLNANNTYFIHATRVSSSAVTWGQALVPPQYAYAFDRTQGALLNFEGVNGSSTITDDFGNAWTASASTISTAQKKFGTSALDCTGGTAKSALTTDIKMLGDGSWEMSIWVYFTSVPGSGGRSTIMYAANDTDFGVVLNLFNNAGTTKLELYVSSDGTSNGVANGTVGTNTTWALNQWNKIRIVFDALGGTYKLYLSLNGAAETTDISVASSAKVCAITRVKLGNNRLDSNVFTGYLDAFRFLRCATVTAAETPSVNAPAIGDYPYHFFSIPAMTMYEVTSASASGGVNPSMTQRNRVFVGEADTGAAAVSAIRNYALRGEYLSTLGSVLAASSSRSYGHNIGTTLVYARIELVNITTQTGYKPGMIAHPTTIGQSGTSEYAADPISIADRNTVTVATTSFTTFLLVDPTGVNNVFGIVAANWNQRVRVKREF